MTHELSLLADLLRKVRAVSHEHGDRPVVGVTLRLGALAHIAPDHLREHFVHASRDTVAAGARLVIHQAHDLEDPHAQDIMLESVEVSD